MTDGPHKSLPMPRHWKRVAKFADSDVYGDEEVEKALLVAVARDFRDLPKKWLSNVGEILNDPEDTIFPESKTAKIDELRAIEGPSALAALLSDAIVSRLLDNAPKQGSQEQVVAQTFGIWISRHIRQTEEHYLRESSQGRAHHVQKRMADAGRSLLGRGALTRLWGRESGMKMAVNYHKMTGVDEGPRL